MLGHHSVGKPASFHDWAKDKKETCGHDSAAVFSGKTQTDLNERSSVVLRWPQLQGQQLGFTSPDPRHVDEDKGRGGGATVGTRNVKTNRWRHTTCTRPQGLLVSYRLISGHASLCNGDTVIQTDFVLFRNNS